MKQQAIDAAFAIRIEHDLHGADKILDVRTITQVRSRSENVQALETLEERHRFRADQDDIDFNTLVLPCAHFTQHALEQVDVQATGKAAIRRNDDHANTLHVTLDEERVLVIGVRLRKMPDHAANFFRVRT